MQKTLIAACMAAAFVPAAHAEKYFSDSSLLILYSDDYARVNFDGAGKKTSQTFFTFENISKFSLRTRTKIPFS